jgi:adenylyl-sulfate kinase
MSLFTDEPGPDNGPIPFGPAPGRPRGAVIWLTGLSGSGKTTLARALEHELLAEGVPCAVVDGDELREGLSSDLGYSPSDRRENIRRAAEVALYLAGAGVVAIVSHISPLRHSRDLAAVRLRRRGIRFAEVFVNAPIAVCEQRDPKGLYLKARAGRIREFTGIDSPYEAPLRPDLEIRTDFETVGQSLARLNALARQLTGNDSAAAPAWRISAGY